MSDKKNDMLTIIVIAGIVLAFSLVDFWAKFGLFGEKRVPKPSESIEVTQVNFHRGDMLKQYADWEAEHFFNRAKFEKINFDLRLFWGKRDLDDIYIGKHGRYFEMHPQGAYREEMILEGLGELGRIAEEFDAEILLVPTSDEIWKKDLPAYADSFDQKAFLERVKAFVGTEHLLDVWSVLKGLEEEKIYYDTDPHWTTFAAYKTYLAWREKKGEQPYYWDENKQVLITKHFRGEYGIHEQLEMKDDALYIFRETYRNPIVVELDGERNLEGFYRPEFMSGEHGYDYFLGNDFTIAKIETGRAREKSLVLLGDSYARCMIPFLAPHYQTITFWNLDNCRGNLLEILKGQETKDVDYMLLQSVPGFLNRFGKDLEE